MDPYSDDSHSYGVPEATKQSISQYLTSNKNVKITVGDGDKKKTRCPNEDLLRSKLLFFQRFFQEVFVEVISKAMALPEDEPGVFGESIDWIYGKTFGRDNMKVYLLASLYLLPIIKLYVFADKIEAEEVATIIVDVCEFYYEQFLPNKTEVLYIYNHNHTKTANLDLWLWI